MLLNEYECRDRAREYESRIAEHGEERGREMFNADFQRNTRQHGITYENMSLRELFEAFVGREALDSLRPRRRAGGVTRYESAEGVSTAAFSNIIGQVTYASIMEKYEDPDFIRSELATTHPATTAHREMKPGITRLGDKSKKVGEMEQYPIVGLGSEYITIPEKIKDGFIVPLSKEAVWEDKTGVLLERAREVAHWMGVKMEKEAIDNAIGTTETYSRNGGPEQATYANTHTQGDFDNLSASTALTDETSVNTVYNLFDDITDPATGEPVMVARNASMLIPTALYHTWLRIYGATSVEFGTRSATVPITASASALQMDRRRSVAPAPLTNAWVKARTGSATTWFMGDFKKAFGYAEAWPLEAEEMGPNSDARFNRDIVAAFKISRMGTYYAMDPRYAIKCTQ